MASTPSTMLELGTPLPAFRLPNAVDGRPVTQDEVMGPRGLLVMFLCNHCPYVMHVRAELARLGADYQPRGLGVVAINANDLEAYPQDGPEHMKRLAQEDGWGFPFLFDATQDVAHAFRAACTPDFFLFDSGRALVYRGRLDDSRPRTDTPVTGRDLRAAIEALLSGRPIPPEQFPSVGCNVKWKADREPHPPAANR